MNTRRPRLHSSHCPLNSVWCFDRVALFRISCSFFLFVKTANIVANFLPHLQGWADDSIFIRRQGQDEEMAAAAAASGGGSGGAFTTGRRGRVPPPPVKPRNAGPQPQVHPYTKRPFQVRFLKFVLITFPSTQVPGKLNLSDFQKVSAALNSMQVDPAKRSSPRGAPLATSEDMDQQGYAVPRDNLAGLGGGGDSGGRPPLPPPGRALPPPPSSGRGGGGGAPAEGPSEYAQPVDPSLGPERRHHSRPKHRERREQLAMQQGEIGFQGMKNTSSSSFLAPCELEYPQICWKRSKI